MPFLFALIATLNVNHTPHHWHMSCERWQKRSQEIMVDENLPYSERIKIVYYLRTKVKGDCPVLS